MRKILIGVMGPGSGATLADLKHAYQLGQEIAQAGWILLTGGRNVGVMEAANQGAKAAGGLTIGILPTDHLQGISQGVDIAILTDMGSARNNINVLSSQVIIACGMGAGTASEIALALKANKPVILLNANLTSQRFFKDLSQTRIFVVNNVEEAITETHRKLGLNLS